MLRKYSNTTLMGGKKTCDKNKAKKPPLQGNHNKRC